MMRIWRAVTGVILTGLLRLLIGFARLAVRLPRQALARTLSAAGRAVRHIGPLQPAEFAFRELADIVAHDDQGLTALRGIACESRRDELAALVRGAVRHYGIGRSPAVLRPPRLPKPRQRLAQRTVLVFGDGQAGRLFTRAYTDGHGCTVARGAGQAGPLNVRDLPAGAVAAEFTAPHPDLEPAIAGCLSRGLAVGVGYGCLSSPGLLRRLESVAARTNTPLRIAYLPAYFPPVTAARTFIADDGLGELVSIRLQAIAGQGGAAPPPAGDPAWHRHEAFDYVPLLVLFGGPIRSAAAYSRAAQPGGGGSTVAAFEFARLPLLGGIECVHAPAMTVRSSWRPQVADAEMAGSDGVIWFTAGPGQRMHGPAVRVRAGSQSHCLGSAQGLRTDWPAAAQAAAGTLLTMAAGRGRPLLTAGECAHALEVTGWLTAPVPGPAPAINAE